MTATAFAQPALAFFHLRWNREISLRRLFWWDIVAVATLLNAAFGLVSLILLSRGLEGGAWLALHLLLLPYNLFLVLAVWRRADAAQPMRYAVLLWLALTVVI